jgi:hypothetical protein
VFSECVNMLSLPRILMLLLFEQKAVNEAATRSGGRPDVVFQLGTHRSLHCVGYMLCPL